MQELLAGNLELERARRKSVRGGERRVRLNGEDLKLRRSASPPWDSTSRAFPELRAFVGVPRGLTGRMLPPPECRIVGEESETTYDHDVPVPEEGADDPQMEETYFCRICLRFCCLLHAVPPIVPRFTPTFVPPPKKPGGLTTTVVVNKEDAGQWSPEEVSMFREALRLFDERDDTRFAQMAMLLGTKTEREIRAFFVHRWSSLVGPWAEGGKVRPSSRCGTRGGAGRKRTGAQAYADYTRYFVPCACDRTTCTDCHRHCAACENCNKSVNSLMATHCPHIGPDAGDGVRNSQCEKYCMCRCSKWKGCRCAFGQCGSGCPCRKQKRECDPDVCRHCGSDFVVHDTAKPGSGRHCGNMVIQCGRFKRLAMGESSIRDAGWGLFTCESIEEDELVGVYAGEVTERFVEEQRVGTGKYSSAINTLQDVNAQFLGNKTRFANDVEGPLPKDTADGVSPSAKKSYHGEGLACNNVCQDILFVGGRFVCCFVATKAMQAGDEVFLSYGGEYWKALGGSGDDNDEGDTSDSDANGDQEGEVQEPPVSVTSTASLSDVSPSLPSLSPRSESSDETASPPVAGPLPIHRDALRVVSTQTPQVARKGAAAKNTMARPTSPGTTKKSDHRRTVVCQERKGRKGGGRRSERRR